jgi:hypothetical protein
MPHFLSPAAGEEHLSNEIQIEAEVAVLRSHERHSSVARRGIVLWCPDENLRSLPVRQDSLQLSLEIGAARQAYSTFDFPPYAEYPVPKSADHSGNKGNSFSVI